MPPFFATVALGSANENATTQAEALPTVRDVGETDAPFFFLFFFFFFFFFFSVFFFFFFFFVVSLKNVGFLVVSLENHGGKPGKQSNIQKGFGSGSPGEFP